jgi:Flp pilus assembly protein TadD
MQRLILSLLIYCGSMSAAGFDLKFEQLTASLLSIGPMDRGVVDGAIDLIKKGEHTVALARLYTVSEKNPDVSALKILSAYSLLQVGNLVGALEQAKKAEAAKDHNSYACFFLAKVAFLTGDKEACRREIKHVKGAGDFKAEIRQLEKDLKRK